MENQSLIQVCDMAKKKNYVMGVNFTTTIYVTVKASDIDEARELAETDASSEFEEKLNDGMLGTSDFDYEAFEA